jgi:hypothetical protein
MSTERPQRKYRQYAVRIEFTLPDMGIDNEYIAEYVASILQDSRLGEYVDAVTDTDIVASHLDYRLQNGELRLAPNAVAQ